MSGIKEFLLLDAIEDVVNFIRGELGEWAVGVDLFCEALGIVMGEIVEVNGVWFWMDTNEAGENVCVCDTVHPSFSDSIFGEEE